MSVEYTANAVQTIQTNGNILFTEDTIGCNRGIILHRRGSGIVTLRGMSERDYARYRVSFGGNVAVATGGAVGGISLAISVNGEVVPSSVMTVTPAAVGDYFNVAKDIIVDVPKGCCATMAITNISDTVVDVRNADIVIDKIS